MYEMVDAMKHGLGAVTVMDAGGYVTVRFPDGRELTLTQDAEGDVLSCEAGGDWQRDLPGWAYELHEAAEVAAKLEDHLKELTVLPVKRDGNVLIVGRRRLRVEFSYEKGRYRLYLRDNGPRVMFDLDADRFVRRAFSWLTL